MDDRLTELTLRDVVERLATKSPVPGGGSASALAGAMGAALLSMVVELSSRGDEAGQPNSRTELRDIHTAAAQWQSELLNLAQLDANAYAAVVQARRLPRGSDLERQARDVQVAAAVREATRAPLHVLRAAAEVLGLAERLAPLGAVKAISDVGVSAVLAHAAARGAALNVRINLPAVDDDDLRQEATRTLDELLPALERRQRAVAAAVEERLG